MGRKRNNKKMQTKQELKKLNCIFLLILVFANFRSCWNFHSVRISQRLNIACLGYLVCGSFIIIIISCGLIIFFHWQRAARLPTEHSLILFGRTRCYQPRAQRFRRSNFPANVCLRFEGDVIQTEASCVVSARPSVLAHILHFVPLISSSGGSFDYTYISYNN